jgi:hypothetical protein
MARIPKISADHFLGDILNISTGRKADGSLHYMGRLKKLSDLWSWMMPLEVCV